MEWRNQLGASGIKGTNEKFTWFHKQKEYCRMNAACAYKVQVHSVRGKLNSEATLLFDLQGIEKRLFAPTIPHRDSLMIGIDWLTLYFH